MKTLTFLLLAFLIVPTWSEFKDLEGKFQILVPMKPSFKNLSVNSEYGIIESKVLTMYSDSNINQYLLGYADYPLIKSEKINDFFKSRIIGAVNNIHGKLLSEEIVNYKNYPGRKIRVLWKNGELVNNAIFYLVNNRLFILQVTTSISNDFNKDIYRFLNSFTYIE
jgi:hypothetical protein